MVTPRFGGGVERHLQDLCGFFANEMVCLVLQPLFVDRVALRLSIHPAALSLTFLLPQGATHLREVLVYLGISSIHFHHGHDVPDVVWELPRLIAVPYDVTLHDHYFINANPFQSDETGRFCEDVEQQARPHLLPMPLLEWQRVQLTRLNGSRRVLAPCRFTSDLYRRHFPDLDIRVAYHPDWSETAPYPSVRLLKLMADHPLRILVMGAINREKGADVVEAVAKLSRDRGSPLEFLLLGYAYRPLRGPIQDLGTYAHENVPEHLAQIKPHLIWFPAQVPETYSYALSEVLVCGMPVLACDLGAFPERLQGRPLTWVAHWKADANGWHDALMGIREELLSYADPENTIPWSRQPDPGRRFYRDEYLQAIVRRPPESAKIDLAWIAEAAAAGIVGRYLLSPRQRLMLAYARLRAKRGGRALIRLVPGWARDWVKRGL